MDDSDYFLNFASESDSDNNNFSGRFGGIQFDDSFISTTSPLTSSMSSTDAFLKIPDNEANLGITYYGDNGQNTINSEP
mgnify:CR=1 FL=1